VMGQHKLKHTFKVTITSSCSTTRIVEPIIPFKRVRQYFVENSSLVFDSFD
jgi:hypothetical protein